jgi:hypothetical protein
VRIYKSKWFHRFTRREGIPDSALRDAVARAEKGQIDADLGGGVIKQRIARPGEGRSAGYRTILFFRFGSSSSRLLATSSTYHPSNSKNFSREETSWR